MQAADFPLLLESSAFAASPLLYDVNGDGIEDAIVFDTDGGVYILGLVTGEDDYRYMDHTQVPRLYVRKNWIEALVNETKRNSLNETQEEAKDTGFNDPYHSYFEYLYSSSTDKNLMRGVSANLLDQEHDAIRSMRQRKSQRIMHRVQMQEEILSPLGEEIGDPALQQLEEDKKTDHEEEGPEMDQETPHRRLQEVSEEDVEKYDEEKAPPLPEVEDYDDYVPPTDDFDKDLIDNNAGGNHDDALHDYDRDYYDEYRGMYHDIDDLYMYHDSARSDYYDSKHYIRITPHILAEPVLAEVRKQYTQENEMDVMIFIPVSYYFDEDEYEGLFSYNRFSDGDIGDETEVKRGQYVASAILSYIVGDGKRWAGQEHLDLSSDFTGTENITLVGSLPLQKDSTRMGAFALASPTVVDLDGDGSLEVIIGTSMGMIYIFEARTMLKRSNWPVQVQYPIEHRIITEDVLGDANMELFILDIVGDVVCLSHDAKQLWYRSPRSSFGGSQVRASSPLVLGDVNGDGALDLVFVLKTDAEVLIFAFDAATGRDISNFPLKISSHSYDSVNEEELHKKLPAPLLVDLHTSGYHKYIESYIRRNGTKQVPLDRGKTGPKPPPGGRSSGLHIVYPYGEDLFIVEAGSGCTQKLSIGSNITCMVQVDDVHATGMLDLVVATESGDIVTLETTAPFHPLNSWNHGEVRGLSNSYAHGYSASQGIFVHDVSRQFIDVFGVFLPITFEIFDNRRLAPLDTHRKYLVEVRAGTSWKRALFRKEYSSPGVYTEQIFPRFGPGYYSINVVLKTSHGLQFEDSFSIGYNVKFMEGFGMLLVFPLVLSIVIIVACGVKKPRWDDDDAFDEDRGNDSLGILGRSSLPS